MARKKNRKRNQGRRYDIDEWVQFVVDGLADGSAKITDELQAAADAFAKEAQRAVVVCTEKYPPQAGYSERILWNESLAYDIYATLAGEGVGIWDGRWDEFYPNATQKHWDKLTACLRKELQAPYAELEAAFMDAAFASQESPRRSKKSGRRNPSKRKYPEEVRRLELGQGKHAVLIGTSTKTKGMVRPMTIETWTVWDEDGPAGQYEIFRSSTLEPWTYWTGARKHPDGTAVAAARSEAKSNPSTMPGGSVSGCIKAQKKKRGKKPGDPGAYCAAVADRIEPGWRGTGGKKGKTMAKRNPKGDKLYYVTFATMVDGASQAWPEAIVIRAPSVSRASKAFTESIEEDEEWWGPYFEDGSVVQVASADSLRGGGARFVHPLEDEEFAYFDILDFEEVASLDEAKGKAKDLVRMDRKPMRLYKVGRGGSLERSTRDANPKRGKKGRKRNQGRHYDASEWVDFELDGMLEGAVQETDLDPSDVQLHHTKKLELSRAVFTTQANRVVAAWLNKPPGITSGLEGTDDVETDDDVAFNTWAALVGHGVGFWEHIADSDWKSLKAAIESDKRLKKAFEKLQADMDDVVYSAIEEAGGGAQDNPKRGRGRKKGAKKNPYQGDAVALAKYRKDHDAWIRRGRRGPPPLKPGARGSQRAANPNGLTKAWVENKQGAVIDDSFAVAKKYAQARADYHGKEQSIYEDPDRADIWIVVPGYLDSAKYGDRRGAFSPSKKNPCDCPTTRLAKSLANP